MTNYRIIDRNIILGPKQGPTGDVEGLAEPLHSPSIPLPLPLGRCHGNGREIAAPIDSSRRGHRTSQSSRRRELLSRLPSSAAALP